MADRRVRLPSGRSFTTYMRAHLIDKSTSWGWHDFVPISPVGADEHFYRCARCHGVAAEWELAEGLWKARLGDICPEFLLSLPPAEKRTTTMPTIADIKLAAEGDLANAESQLEDLKNRQVDLRNEIKAVTAQRNEAQRILSALTPRTRTRKVAPKEG